MLLFIPCTPWLHIELHKPFYHGLAMYDLSIHPLFRLYWFLIAWYETVCTFALSHASSILEISLVRAMPFKLFSLPALLGEYWLGNKLTKSRSYCIVGPWGKVPYQRSHYNHLTAVVCDTALAPVSIVARTVDDCEHRTWLETSRVNSNTQRITRVSFIT